MHGIIGVRAYYRGVPRHIVQQEHVTSLPADVLKSHTRVCIAKLALKGNLEMVLPCHDFVKGLRFSVDVCDSSKADITGVIYVKKVFVRSQIDRIEPQANNLSRIGLHV